LLDQLAAYGDGAVTLQLVRSVLGLSDEQSVHELMTCLAAHDVGGGLDVIDRVVEQGVDARQYAQQVVDYARLVLLTRVAGDSTAVDVGERMQAELGELAARLSTHELVRSIKLFNQAQLDLRGSDQSRIALELALVEAALPEGEPVDEPVPVAPARAAPRPSTVRENAPRPVGVAPPSAPPAAPPRIPTEMKAEGAPEAVEPSEQAVSSTDPQLVAVTMEEVNASWDKVKQLVKSESAQAEALINSALSRDIESVNRLVFRLASELLASKLEKEENKRIVERALTSVLGKPCRVRGEAGTTVASVQEARSAGPAPLPRRGPGAHEGGEPLQGDGSTETASPEDHYREAASDPVIQDLISKGGKITDVQLLSEE
jgi:DNA polymerase-3 subunit gamma/tau